MKTMEASGSNARSARRKSKGMGQNGPLSSVGRDTRESFFWVGGATPAAGGGAGAAAATPRITSTSSPNSRGSLLGGAGGPVPTALSGVNRGFNGGFWDSFSTAGSDFYSSGQYSQSFWGPGYGNGSARYGSGMVGGGDGSAGGRMGSAAGVPYVD
ncbi:unnamed protein product, partial [Ectocarpus sp. 4 AP-2014]